MSNRRRISRHSMLFHVQLTAQKVQVSQCTHVPTPSIVRNHSAKFEQLCRNACATWIASSDKQEWYAGSSDISLA